jgi:hypothetical protein
MKQFLYNTFLFVSVWSTTMAQNSVKSILIIGDSHLKGHFGEFLQKKLNASAKYDVLSIAIGGAGSKTFVGNLDNKCCGYRVRESCAGSTVEEKAKIPVLERAEKPTTKPILHNWGGTLPSLLNNWKPDAIIIVLGSNWINAHTELVAAIKKYKTSVPFIWVGPFSKAKSESRYVEITKAMKNEPSGLLIHADEILPAEKQHLTHFAGKTAQKLAEGVVEKFQPFLDLNLKND